MVSPFLGLTPQAKHLSRLRRSLDAFNTFLDTTCDEPRSGGICIAWGVSPRIQEAKKIMSPGGATDS